MDDIILWNGENAPVRTFLSFFPGEVALEPPSMSVNPHCYRAQTHYGSSILGPSTGEPMRLACNSLSSSLAATMHFIEITLLYVMYSIAKPGS